MNHPKGTPNHSLSECHRFFRFSRIAPIFDPQPRRYIFYVNPFVRHVFAINPYPFSVMKRKIGIELYRVYSRYKRINTRGKMNYR